MKMVVRYFKQHSRSTMIRFAIITFICLVAVTLLTQGIVQDYNRNKEFYETYGNSYYGYDHDWRVYPALPFHVFIIVILCTGLPMVEMSAFNSRKYLDSAFSFPISRVSMLSVNLINGYLQFILAYSISFAWYAMRLAPCADKLYFAPIWAFFFISLLYSLFLYCFNAFFFSLCNATVDGAITAIAWQHIIAVVLATLSDMFNFNMDEDHILMSIVWYPLGTISELYSDSASRNPYLSENDFKVIPIIMIVVTILAILFCAGTLFFFNRKRTESAGEISNTPVSYKVLIPVCAGMLLYWSLEGGGGIISLFALIFSTVGYIIYRRGVRLKVSDLVVIGVCFAAFIMGMMAS
ncbi:MAG: hypothetical protein J6S71_03850 [Clostridia bacterium]|nr:hypothetical protein [Clostridia bacterium]